MKEFEVHQVFCPQCGKPADTDAAFCKHCAFDLNNLNINQNDESDINQIPVKKSFWGIGGAMLLLGAVLIGLVIKSNSKKVSETISESANATSQESASILTISEKAKQIEEKILRDEALNVSDLEGLSLQELRILRNIHFARYGRKYDRPGLGDYFYTRSWYKSSDSFSENLLSSTDKANVKLILSAENPANSQSMTSNSSIEEEVKNVEEEQPSTLHEEAQKQAETFWKKNLAKCGDSYYWEEEATFYGIKQELFECRGEPSIYAEGEVFELRVLTEAEKLNGIDPQPEEWKGNAIVNFPACRNMWKFKHIPPENKTPWSQWKDNISSRIKLWKSKGQWNLTNIPPDQNGFTGFFIKKLQCSNIPHY